MNALYTNAIMEQQLVSVYSGTEASVQLLKGKLEMMGISAEIRKDSNAGTWGVVPDNIDLYIESAYRKAAEPIIEEFTSNRHVEKL